MISFDHSHRLDSPSMTTLASDDGKKSTVFIVDDDLAYANSMKFLIGTVHEQIVCYPSAQDFLRDYKSDMPGCLVSDVRMPGMSGLELQELLRERDVLLPVIIISAFGDVPVAVRAMRAGAIHVMKKPFDDNELLETIQRALSEDARRREEHASTEAILQRYEQLTDREKEVFKEVIEGLSSREIGEKFDVSFKTIEAHRAKIMRKMEADNIPQLLKLWFVLQPILQVR